MPRTGELIHDDLYNYPQYYDLVYGSDWKAEFRFLENCFRRYAWGVAPRRKVRRIFEPACGTGRLLIKLAQAGYEVSGNDLNEKAVRYCNRRLERHSFPASATVGDMSDFTLQRRVDAAFNMINSFRHLESEAAARSHLQCVAAALRPGGIYVLGLHLTPTTSDPEDAESWSARRGHLAVISSLQTLERDMRKRRERVGMAYDVYTPTRQFRLAGVLSFRTYTCDQFLALLKKVTALHVVAVHDFRYDIEKPIELDSDVEDAVFVMKKK